MSSIALLGASGTIGSVLARRLVAAERSVILLGRDESKLAPLAAELGQPYDIVDWTQSQSLEQTLEARVGQGIVLGGIVNCIGSVLLKGAHATSDAEFRDIETNLFTAFSAVKAAGKLLRENGGSVVLFASAAAEIGIANHEAIAAAKAGIIGLARSAAATYAQHNIRFNVVSPGLIRTELTRRIWSNPASSAASESMHASSDWASPNR
ncbi:MAG: SDR family oxidoreductase [Pirellulaceae bacterium]